MFAFDSDSRLQLARERAADLARDFERSRSASEASRASVRRRRVSVAYVRHSRRRPAYDR